MKHTRIAFRLSEEDKALLELAAAVERCSMSAFITRAAVREAQRITATDAESVRAVNKAMKATGLKLDELAKLPYVELLRLPNVGTGTIDAIARAAAAQAANEQLKQERSGK